MLDGSGFDDQHPALCLKVLLKELELYNQDLLSKPMLVAVNKSDREFVNFDEKYL